MGKICILGASNKPERYAHMANALLKKNGYETVLVNPSHSTIDGQKTYAELSAIDEDIDVLTIYIRPALSNDPELIKEIKRLAPKTVIFNPGTENAKLEKEIEEAGLKSLQACTLVLLNTQQFEYYAS